MPELVEKMRGKTFPARIAKLHTKAGGGAKACRPRRGKEWRLTTFHLAGFVLLSQTYNNQKHRDNARNKMAAPTTYAQGSHNCQTCALYSSVTIAGPAKILLPAGDRCPSPKAG